jgi:hypothetical protein
MEVEKAMQSFRGFEERRDRKKANRKVKAMLRNGLVSEEQAAGLFRKDEKAAEAHRRRLQKEEEDAQQRERGRAQHFSKGAGKRQDNTVGGGHGRQEVAPAAKKQDRGGGQASSSNQGQAEGRTSQGGLQYKGEGKGGSLGVLVGPSRGTPVKVMMENTTGRKEVYANDDVVVKKKTSEASDWTQGIPTPLPRYASDTEIQKECFDTKYFYKVDFWNGDDIWNLQNGSHVLWKRAPVGRNGGPSTKQEFFHGMIHGWHNDYEVLIS